MLGPNRKITLTRVPKDHNWAASAIGKTPNIKMIIKHNMDVHTSNFVDIEMNTVLGTKIQFTCIPKPDARVC